MTRGRVKRRLRGASMALQIPSVWTQWESRGGSWDVGKLQ